MLKNTALSTVLALTTALVSAGAALAQDAAAPAAPVVPEGGAEAVVATVNGKDILLGHLIALRQNLPAQYQALPDDMLFSGLLEQLVQQQLLADTTGELTLSERLGMENDDRGYLSGVAIGKVIEAAVTDEALQTAYAAMLSEFKPTTEYHAAHILVGSEEEAAKIKAEIEGGLAFADAARTHSTDGAAANGGDLGWFGAGMMVEPFQVAVEGMKVGEIAGPVQTQFGWHLIDLKETRDSAPASFDEMRDELAVEIEQGAVEAHLAQLTEAAKIERPGTDFDPALLRQTDLLK